jgi:hypothetical protein
VLQTLSARPWRIELGLSAAAIDHRVRAGKLIVLHRGVYRRERGALAAGGAAIGVDRQLARLAGLRLALPGAYGEVLHWSSRSTSRSVTMSCKARSSSSVAEPFEAVQDEVEPE